MQAGLWPLNGGYPLVSKAVDHIQNGNDCGGGRGGRRWRHLFQDQNEVRESISERKYQCIYHHEWSNIFINLTKFLDKFPAD